LQWVLAVYILSAVLISYMPWGADVSQGVGVVLAFCFLVRLLVERRGLSLTRELLALALFASYTMVGALLAKNLAAFLTSEATLLQIYILVVIIYEVCRSDKASSLLMRVFVGAVAAASVLTVLGVNYYSPNRLGGVLGNPNTYGATLFFAIALAIYLLSTGVRKRERVLLIAIIPWLAWNVLLSGSRTAMLGVAVFVATLYLLYARRKMLARPARTLAIGVLLVGMVVGAVFCFSQDATMQRRLGNLWQTLVSGGKQVVGSGLETRYQFIQAALEVWQDHPFLGVGTNQFRFHAMGYNPDLYTTYAHSDYAEILADFGVVGFILYYTVFVFLVVRVLRLRARKRNTREIWRIEVIAAFLTAYFVMELGYVWYYDKASWIVLALLLCALQDRRVQGEELASHGS